MIINVHADHPTRDYEFFGDPFGEALNDYVNTDCDFIDKVVRAIKNIECKLV